MPDYNIDNPVAPPGVPQELWNGSTARGRQAWITYAMGNQPGPSNPTPTPQPPIPTGSGWEKVRSDVGSVVNTVKGWLTPTSIYKGGVPTPDWTGPTGVQATPAGTLPSSIAAILNGATPTPPGPTEPPTPTPQGPTEPPTPQKPLSGALNEPEIRVISDYDYEVAPDPLTGEESYRYIGPHRKPTTPDKPTQRSIFSRHDGKTGITYYKDQQQQANGAWTDVGMEYPVRQEARDTATGPEKRTVEGPPDLQGRPTELDQVWGDIGLNDYEGAPTMGWVTIGNPRVVGAAPKDTTAADEAYRQAQLELDRQKAEADRAYQSAMLESARQKAAATTQAQRDNAARQQAELDFQKQQADADNRYRQAELDFQRTAAITAQANREADAAAAKEKYLNELRANPRKWIEYGMASGSAPIVPKWLADISGGALQEGQRLSAQNKVPIAALTRAMWDRLSPTQRDMLEGYLSWLGADANDYYSNLWWMGGQGAVRTQGNAPQGAFKQYA